MTKVQILSSCEFCKGQAYMPIGEAHDSKGQSYSRFQACAYCNGSGQRAKWVTLQQFAQLLLHEYCPHTHTSSQGTFRFTDGEVWDNVQEVCDDCGTLLDFQQPSE